MFSMLEQRVVLMSVVPPLHHGWQLGLLKARSDTDEAFHGRNCLLPTALGISLLDTCLVERSW